MAKRMILLFFLTISLFSAPDIFGPVPSNRGKTGKTELRTTDREYSLAGVIYSSRTKMAFFLHESGKYLILKEGQGSKRGLKLLKIEGPLKVIVLWKGRKKELSIPGKRRKK